MQYDPNTPAESEGFIPASDPNDSDKSLVVRATTTASQPRLVSVALSPEILENAESRRAIMFQRAPRLGLERLARFVQRDLEVSAVMISLVEGDQQVALYASGLPEPWASRQSLPLTQALSQYPVTSGDSFIIEDALQHSWLHTNAAMQDTGMRAYAGLPLVGVDGQILGALCAVDQQPRRWKSAQVEVLRRVALQIANILALDLATQSLRILMRQQPAAGAEDRCLAVLARIFRWDVVSLWRQQYGATEVDCAALWRSERLAGPVEDAYIERIRQFKMPPGETLVGMVAKSREALWIPDIERESRAPLRTTMTKLQLKSVFVFPVTLGTRVICVIASLSRESNPYGQELGSTIAVLGGQIGAYLLKAQRQAAGTVH